MQASIRTTGIKTIDRHGLEQQLEQDTVTLLMTESPLRFQLGHIPRSACFSLTYLAHLPVERTLVIYAMHHPSIVTYWAYQLLVERGFDVRLYQGGLHDWYKAGLPIETSDFATLPMTLPIEVNR